LILKALFESGLLRRSNLTLEEALLPHFLGSLPRRVADVSESIVTEERIRVKEILKRNWRLCAGTTIVSEQIGKVCQFIRGHRQESGFGKTQQNKEKSSFRGASFLRITEAR